MSERSFCKYCKGILTSPSEIQLHSHISCQNEISEPNVIISIQHYLYNQPLLNPNYIFDDNDYEYVLPPNCKSVIGYSNEEVVRNENDIINLIFFFGLDGLLREVILEAADNTIIRDLLAVLELTNFQKLDIKYPNLEFPSELFKLNSLRHLSFKCFRCLIGTYEVDFTNFESLDLISLNLDLDDSFKFEGRELLFKIGELKNITSIKTKELILTNTWVHKEFYNSNIEKLKIMVQDDEIWEYDLDLANLPYQLKDLTINIIGRIKLYNINKTVTKLSCEMWVEKEKRKTILMKMLESFPNVNHLLLNIKSYGDEEIDNKSTEFTEIRNHFRNIINENTMNKISYNIKIDYFGHKKNGIRVDSYLLFKKIL